MATWISATMPAPTIMPCGTYALAMSPPGMIEANSGLLNSIVE